MSNTLVREVLKAFKSLHKTSRYVFEGDERALAKVRQQINEEYKKCKNVSNSEAIQELINFSRAVENELRTTVIQAKEVHPGQYEVRLRNDIAKLENIPYKECVDKH